MYNSVGIIEISNISKGIEACDIALKAAGIELISAQPICPGKYELIFTGKLSDVTASSEIIDRDFGQYIIDSVVLGKIEQVVITSLLGGAVEVDKNALGIVETFTAASAIKAADTAIKSANVAIVELRVSRGMGGKGYVILTGDIGDVSAAVKAGESYAKEQGLFVGSTIIAAPHEDLWDKL